MKRLIQLISYCLLWEYTGQTACAKYRDFNAKNRLYLYELGHYATNRTIAGSRPDEVNELFSIYLNLPAALGPGVHSASNRNEYPKQKNNVSGE
jgi:hypothetical protein